MVHVSASDALRALKTFKRLAKQDFLVSVHTDNPEFWSRQAEARRETYDELMIVVQKDGVEAARRYALDELAVLPLFGSEKFIAARRGKQQALRMFCSLFDYGRHPAVAEIRRRANHKLEASS